jgi:hypothetical protein
VNNDTSLSACLTFPRSINWATKNSLSGMVCSERKSRIWLIIWIDVPTHHQVDPRVIEAHLGISTAPTFHIGSQEYSLVSRHYHEYYLNWLAAVDVNNQSIQWCSQGLQAGLDCWRNRYLWTNLYFNDSFLRENYYWSLPTIRLVTGILWYAHRTPSTIYAMAKAIIQLCPHSPMAPLPDFQNLSPEQKEGIY